MGSIAGHRATLTLLAVVTVCGGGASSEEAPPTRRTSLHLRSAKRTERYDDRFTKLVARDPAKDVILVVELAGISVDDFDATAASEVFLMAEGRRFEPSFRTSGDWEQADASGVKEERRVVVIVPRDTLTFSLHFGKRAPLAVETDRAIASVLP